LDVDLSIVIPVRNESHVLAGTLNHLSEASIREIIVVDGGSRDDTVAIARSCGAKVVISEPGRGGQLNAGAATAVGESLLFMHADTQLPSGFEHEVAAILRRLGVVAGAFRLCIDSPKLAYRLIEKMVDYRSRWFQLPYGDQAIFVGAETFRKLGGFPALPVMEDFVFARNLIRLGHIRMAQSSVTTSCRRWESEGVLRTTLRNQAIIMGYWLGVSPERLAKWRYGVDYQDVVTIATQELS